jgi:hypothetical protein
VTLPGYRERSPFEKVHESLPAAARREFDDLLVAFMRKLAKAEDEGKLAEMIPAGTPRWVELGPYEVLCRAPRREGELELIEFWNLRVRGE